MVVKFVLVCVLKLSDVLSSLLKENISSNHPKKLYFTVYSPFYIILTNNAYIEVNLDGIGSNGMMCLCPPEISTENPHRLLPPDFPPT